MKTQLLPSILASSLLFAINAHADHPAQESENDDFLDFSLEELISLDIPDVTSVARLNGNTWSISTRGFNYIFANKLLVLIDGMIGLKRSGKKINFSINNTSATDADLSISSKLLKLAKTVK